METVTPMHVLYRAPAIRTTASEDDTPDFDDQILTDSERIAVLPPRHPPLFTPANPLRMGRNKGKERGARAGEKPHPSEREKVCPVCGRPFSWRRKWARDWERVRYCSKACAKRKRDRPAESGEQG